MNYKEYSAIEFLKDQYFVSWVTNPSHESEAFWREWIRMNPDKQKEVEAAREILLSTTYKNHYELSEAESSLILENVLRARVNEDSTASNRSQSWKWIYRAAAVLSIILSVAIYAWMMGSNDRQGKPAGQLLVEKSTNFGEKRTLGLPDGTIIKLNAGSRISYLQPFDKGERRVSLQGEAFFEVTRDESRPFIIETAGLTTRVLGTSFNISSYQEAGSIKVSVLSGMVEIANRKGQKEILYPDMMGVLYKDTENLNKTSFDEKAEFGWKDGIIYFNNNHLAEVFIKLEKWYGVQIKIDSSEPLKGTYTGEYVNASLEKVLEGICYTSGLTYSIDGSNVSVKLLTTLP